MKYSEFKAEVEKLGYLAVCEDGSPVYVDKDSGGETIISIGRHKRFNLDPAWSGFHGLSEDQQLTIYDLACELAKTPLAEREEEKRYRLRISAPLVKNDGYVYLTYIPVSAWYQLGSAKRDDDLFKTIFTESEIAEMDVTGFEKVEVQE